MMEQMGYYSIIKFIWNCLCTCFFCLKRWKSSDPEACSYLGPATGCNGRNTGVASWEARTLGEILVHMIHWPGAVVYVWKIPSFELKRHDKTMLVTLTTSRKSLFICLSSTTIFAATAVEPLLPSLPVAITISVSKSCIHKMRTIWFRYLCLFLFINDDKIG